MHSMKIEIFFFFSNEENDKIIEIKTFFDENDEWVVMEKQMAKGPCGCSRSDR